MAEMPTSRYIEIRNRGCYIAGTRISLDSVAYAIRRGETVEGILADFHALESRQKLEGAIEFIQSHPREIEAYLTEQAERWEEARKLNPPELAEKARKYREERATKPV